MAEVSITRPQDGEEVLPAPAQLRILEDGSTTDHRLALGVITMQPQTDGPPAHWHQQHDEGFYVLAGTPRFTIGDDDHDAPPGTLVMIPPGVPHTFANPSDDTSVIFVTFTPDLYVGYFRELGDRMASGAPLTREANIEVMARYATYPAGQPAPARPV
jgi:mannose-6-phosphate isomerase-like protein (cupin superfamily)